MISTLGAEALPGFLPEERNPELKVVRFAANAEPGGADLNADSIPGVLMLRCSALSHHAVRAAARQAGLALSLDFAEDRREFLDELCRNSTDLIIAGAEALPDLEMREVLDRARSAQPPIPVLVAGGHASQREAIGILRQGATDYLQSGDMERLPSAIARGLKVRQFAAAQTAAQRDLERAALSMRQNQKLITTGRLAASIAHEINNPLESVTNLLYLLGEDKDLTPSARGYLQLAQRELERVAQISRQTLNFSREAPGPVRTRIEDLLEEVLSLYSRRITEKNLSVARDYQCAQELSIYPGEMRQVLSNLVTNAIEASSTNGRLRLRTRCSRSWSDPGVRGIRISVADTGSGIDPAVQRRLGQPFFTTKGQRGTGLGLWVTRSIVQRRGGEIQLRSSVDPRHHGTVFSIFLPTNLRPRIVENPGWGNGDSGGSGDGESEPRDPGDRGGPVHRPERSPMRRWAEG